MEGMCVHVRGGVCVCVWGGGDRKGRRRGGDINSLLFPSLPPVIPFDEIL